MDNKIKIRNVSTGKWKLIIILCLCSLENYYASGRIIPQFINLAEGVACGETQFFTKQRILGGEGAEVGEFPFLASIQKADMHFCSAFIIKRNKLLSAAHCFIKSFYGSESYKDYQILVGSNDWVDRSNSSNLYRISNVLLHPEYSFLKPNVENDIAVITLDRSLEWSSTVQPICLANEDRIRHEEGTIAGWGIRSHKENMKEWMKDTTLHKVSLPIWSNDDCQAAYRRQHVNWNMRETHFCAGYQEKDQDTSSGDSGSPLVLIGENGNSIAYGIVSVGEGSILPGIYTRLSKYLTWITTATTM